MKRIFKWKWTRSQLVTINTHRGLYHFNRLPFGVKPAAGIFQQCVDASIAGIDGTAAYLDDILVTGRTTGEHNARLEALFKRIQDYGLRVRLDKCAFLQTKITYLGFVIAQGRRPDPERIEAIQKTLAPKDLGYSVDPLRPKSPDHRCFKPRDGSNPLTSLRRWIREGHLSRKPLPDTTIEELQPGEKEALALIFAVQKFHRFIHERHFTLSTDHGPLLAIFGSKKGVPVYSANHLQRWATMLLNYSFTVEYINTKDFGQVDALSRLVTIINTGGLRDRRNRC
ncbi:hypothetical protein RB195_024126 [Necator americanus]|uniref:Reverse transcriptase domain-containing protein n=1 Tax=Necator americanus TaxID=51031 RepID=A0ABR1EMS3_NECAM